MAKCDVGYAESKIKESYFSKVLGGSKAKDKNIVEGYLEMVYTKNGTARDNLLNFSKIPQDIKSYAMEYIPKAKEMFKDKSNVKVEDVIAVLDENPDSYKKLIYKIHEELRVLSHIQGSNYDKAKRDMREDVGFLNYYANISSFEKLHSQMAYWLLGPKDVFGEKSHFFKQHGMVNDLEADNERITFANRGAFTAMNTTIQKTSNYFADKIIINDKKPVSVDELNTYVKAFDNSNEYGENRLLETLNKKFDGDKESVRLVTNVAKAYFDELQLMNYGFPIEEAKQKMLSFKDNEDGEDNLAFYKANKDIMYTPKYKGAEAIPVYLSVMANIGTRLSKQILGGRKDAITRYGGTSDYKANLRLVLKDTGHEVKAAENIIHPAEAYFLKKFSHTLGGDDSFNPKTGGYIPSKEGDPLSNMFEEAKGHANVFRKIGSLDHSDFKAKDGTSFIEGWTTNTKQWLHLVERLSEYATKKTEGILLTNKNKDGQTFGDVNPKAYNIINRDVEAVMRDFQRSFDGGSKKNGEFFYSFKGLIQSLIGATGTSILATAGLKNAVAGGIGLTATFGMDFPGLVKKYKADILMQNEDGEIAREVRRYLHWEAPVATKTDDVIVYDGKVIQKTQALPKAIDWATDKLSKFSKFNSDGSLFKLIPFIGGAYEKYASFNATENALNSYNNCLLHDIASTHMTSWREANPVGNYKDTAEYNEAKSTELNRVIRDNENITSLKTKEAIGNFSKSAKPRWTYSLLRDAETYTQVITGAIGAMAYMFKQVSPLNMELVNKALVSVTGGGNPVRALRNMSSGSIKTAGVGGVGMLALALYEILSDEDDDSMNPVSPMMEGLYPESMTTVIAKRTLKYAAAMIAGVPINGTDEIHKESIQLLKFAGGVGMSSFLTSLYKENVMGQTIKNKFDVKHFGQSVMSLVVAPVDLAKGIVDKDVSIYDFKSKLYHTLGYLSDTPIMGPLLSRSNDNLKLIGNFGLAAKAYWHSIQGETPKERTTYAKQRKEIFESMILKAMDSALYFKTSYYDDVKKIKEREWRSKWEDYSRKDKLNHRSSYTPKDYSVAAQIERQILQGRTINQWTLKNIISRNAQYNN